MGVGAGRFTEEERMMETEEQLAKYEEALELIRDFGHKADCTSCAPVYECGCYDKSQAEIAEEALR